jgi:hypothetical protein
VTYNLVPLMVAYWLVHALGLWPAAWLMGNLARATFEKTTTVSLQSFHVTRPPNVD